MPKPLPGYEWVLIETYANTAEDYSREPVRARPTAGQGLSSRLYVSCSIRMRHASPVGSKFILRGKRTMHPERGGYIACPTVWDWYPVTEAEAEKFLRGETLILLGARTRKPQKIARSTEDAAATALSLAGGVGERTG